MNQPPPDPPETSRLICPNCQVVNPLDATVCRRCGSPLARVNLAESPPPSGNLLETYRRALIRPSVAAYESEVQNAGWSRIALSLVVATVAVSLIEAIVTIVNPPIFPSSPTGAIIGVPVGFFLLALCLYGLAKLFGGKGRTGNFSRDFVVHAYLLVLIFAPLIILQSVLLQLGLFGSFALLLLAFYQIYLYRHAVQVSQQLSPTRAVWTIMTFVVLAFLLYIALVIILFRVIL